MCIMYMIVYVQCNMGALNVVDDPYCSSGGVKDVFKLNWASQHLIDVFIGPSCRISLLL